MLTKSLIYFLLSFLCLSYVVANIPGNTTGIQLEENGKDKNVAESATNQHENMADYIDHKFDAMQRLILDLKSSLNFKLFVMENLQESEKNISQKIDDILKRIPESEDDIKQKLYALENTLNKNFEKNLNLTLENLKEIPESTERINNKLTVLESKIPKLEESINRTLDIAEKVPDITESNNKLVLSVFEMESKLNRLSNAVDKLIMQSGCKKCLAYGYHYEDIYQLDALEFDHVTLQKNNDNDVVYYEMYIAIKTDMNGIILLSLDQNPGPNDIVFEIGVGIAHNQFTVLRLNMDSSNEVARVATPGILSTTHYTGFYIKISDGVLTFGKKGEKESPLITYAHKLVSKINYIGISSYGSSSAKFLYDCPL